MLKIIHGTPKVKPDKESLYLNALCNKIAEPDSPNKAKQISLLGVKYFNASRSTDKSQELLDAQLLLYHYIQTFMSQLTPREFMQIFPIEKDYDGDKSGCKDYFYTIKFIESIGFDAPIGMEKSLFRFLWEYHNWEIGVFVVCWISLLENAMIQQGIEPPIDKLFDSLGVTPYYLQKDELTGQEYLFNPETGKTQPVYKAIPRYLKLVK